MTFGAIFVILCGIFGLIFLAGGIAIKIKDTDGFFIRFIKIIAKIIMIPCGLFVLFIFLKAIEQLLISH